MWDCKSGCCWTWVTNLSKINFALFPTFYFQTASSEKKDKPMKKICCFICLCFGLFQCKSDETTLPAAATGPLISEIRTDGKLETAFLYNAQNQLIELQKYFDDGKSIWESTRYTWTNNRVERVEFWSSHSLYSSASPAPGKPLALENTTTCEYDAQGRVAKTNNYVGASDLRTYSVWEYDNLGRKVETKTYTPDGKNTSTNSFSYDNRSNLIQHGTSHWEYDDKPNPFRLLNVPAVGRYQNWASANNGTSNFGKDANGNKTNVWRYEYTYDAKTNFPATMKTITSNQTTRQSVFVYR
ncbi:MAG: hypothetical protein EAZ14_01910 [Runella slithyformis]|nr:MAG: hypothetical protein EAZ14_01910 [Runella slithyformis]